MTRACKAGAPSLSREQQPPSNEPARPCARPVPEADLKRLREEHGRSIVPLQTLAAESRTLERNVAEPVNAAYGLTPEEEALMWKTAPPRMPGEAPAY